MCEAWNKSTNVTVHALYGMKDQCNPLACQTVWPKRPAKTRAEKTPADGGFRNKIMVQKAPNKTHFEQPALKCSEKVRNPVVTFVALMVDVPPLAR